ncbi:MULTISPECIES: hypothetical protein [unclassified Afipia]|uniref:hypothetical protein n=2 Tax=Afipia TaxID=1033 RepID=UPI0012681930|nr:MULTISPECIES: hypothetical protein [unclassified Afipia]
MLRIYMSLLAKFFSPHAWLKTTEINLLISDPIAYDEVGFLSQIFDKVLISGHRDGLPRRPDLHTWRENIRVYEPFPCRQIETGRSLSTTCSARWFDLKNFHVLVIFDSGGFSFAHHEPSPWHGTLEHATRIFIGGIETISDDPAPSDIRELADLLDSAPSRSGILLRELAGSASTVGGRPQFTILEYNESVKNVIVAAARSAIEDSLFETRSGLESY